VFTRVRRWLQTLNKGGSPNYGWLGPYLPVVAPQTPSRGLGLRAGAIKPCPTTDESTYVAYRLPSVLLYLT
jgi:hypothetical protein